MSRSFRETQQSEFQGGVQPRSVGNVGAAPVVDADAGETHVLTLTANATIGVPLNAALQPIGTRLVLILVQDVTGTRTVAWNAIFRNAPALSAGTNGQRALCEFRWDGISWQFTGGAAAFA